MLIFSLYVHGTSCLRWVITVSLNKGTKISSLPMDLKARMDFDECSPILQIIKCSSPAGGGQSKFYVHRVVLAIQSRFFKAHHNDDVVEVSEVAPEVMAALLDLAYGARAELRDVAMRADLVAAAERLQLTGILKGMRFEAS